MKKVIEVIVYCALLLGVSKSQAQEYSRIIEIPEDYTGIENKGGFHIIVDSDLKVRELLIDANVKDANRIKVKVKRGVIAISQKRGFDIDDYESLGKVTIYIPFSGALKSLINSGSGKIKLLSPIKKIGKFSVLSLGSGGIMGKIKASYLNVVCSGSGKSELEVESSRLKATLSGSGQLHLKGKSNRAVYNLSGSGTINASKVKSKNTKLNTIGSGTITANSY